MTRILLILSILFFKEPAKAQCFDSVRIYPLCMKSMYRVAIDQDLIKNEVDTIILIDSIKAAEIYTFFKNKICGEKLKKVSRSPSDIRLGLEFFRNGRVVKTIGVTPQRTIYMGDIVYMCNMEALKHIDYFSLELPKLLCLH